MTTVPKRPLIRVATMALALLCVPVAASAARPPTCVDQRGETVYRAGDVRVYDAQRRDGGAAQLRACRLGSRRSMAIADGAHRFTSSAQYLVAAQSIELKYAAQSYSRIWRYDLAQLRRQPRIDVGGSRETPRRLASLLVSRTGTVAWLEQILPQLAEVRDQEIHVLEWGGADEVVDRGLEIDAGSLAMASSPDQLAPTTPTALYWTRGGVPTVRFVR